MTNQELLEILRKIFKDKPEKSTIVLKGRCSDCGCRIILNITSTSGGFGMLGGVLFSCSPSRYFAKCSDCYKVNPNMDGNYKPKYNGLFSDNILEDIWSNL